MTERTSAFWSGETLRERLGTLIDPFVPELVDCAAYTLAIGPEVYVSPHDQDAAPSAVTIRQLSNGEAFTIPPGQFAFLLTEEVVSVPADALAFISIRAKTKFRGLVNVSGFHVDPGYCGQLTFAVFNAGPVPVHLKRGQPAFLIWYTSLDRTTAFKKNGATRKGIDPAVVTGIAGELQSLAGLSKKMEKADRALDERVHAIEKQQARLHVIGAVALTLLITLTVNCLQERAPPASPTPPQVTSESQIPTR
ncbi:MAG: deoxycytidine triphosphate deaminase [Gammaproteobacteria bacterium]|nr:deoxycytidine triphosphate deaminase [Gammaproteobacteria bacterium]